MNLLTINFFGGTIFEKLVKIAAIQSTMCIEKCSSKFQLSLSCKMLIFGVDDLCT